MSIRVNAEKDVPLSRPMACKSNEANRYEVNETRERRCKFADPYVEIRRCYGLVWVTAFFTGRTLVVAALFDSAEKIIRIFRSDIGQ